MRTKKLTTFALLGALAVTLSYLEFLIFPAEMLPVGVRIGLSNLATTFAAYALGAPAAFAVTLIKVAFTFFMRGTAAAWMSLCGGLCATAVIALAVRHIDKAISYVGVSLLAATAHNLGQLAAAMLLSGTAALFHYGKWLLLFAIPTGFVMGAVLNLLLPRIPLGFPMKRKGE